MKNKNELKVIVHNKPSTEKVEKLIKEICKEIELTIKKGSEINEIKTVG